MLVVKKFGGTSVGNAERIFNVARRIAEDYKNGNDIVVVLSAMGKTTDELIAKAHEITDRTSARELDMLLATGEQVSVSLMAIALMKLGIPAVSLNAFRGNREIGQRLPPINARIDWGSNHQTAAQSPQSANRCFAGPYGTRPSF